MREPRVDVALPVAREEFDVVAPGALALEDLEHVARAAAAGAARELVDVEDAQRGRVHALNAFCVVPARAG